MVFGMFLAFEGSSVCYILIPRTFRIFMYVSTLLLINLNVLIILDNKNREQHMIDILIMFVTTITKTPEKGYTLSSLCQKKILRGEHFIEHMIRFNRKHAITNSDAYIYYFINVEVSQYQHKVSSIHVMRK